MSRKRFCSYCHGFCCVLQISCADKKCDIVLSAVNLISLQSIAQKEFNAIYRSFVTCTGNRNEWISNTASIEFQTKHEIVRLFNICLLNDNRDVVRRLRWFAYAGRRVFSQIWLRLNSTGWWKNCHEMGRRKSQQCDFIKGNQSVCFEYVPGDVWCVYIYFSIGDLSHFWIVHIQAKRIQWKVNPFCHRHSAFNPFSCNKHRFTLHSIERNWSHDMISV